MTKKVLIGSPIRRAPNILKAFLDNLDRIKFGEYEPYYYFFDDNNFKESTKLLNDFKITHKNVIIKKADEVITKPTSNYEECGVRNWNNELTDRVAALKDEIIKWAQKQNVDYLLFLDSDMILQPKTFLHLVSRNVDIVSEIFWTDWHGVGVATPSVWNEDENEIVKKADRADKISVKRSIASFNAKLRVPGIYEVGGLGALTLISRHALKKPIGFKRIENLSFFGEDRHFCVRASALGLKMYVDTVYPAFHIFREQLLTKLPLFLKYGYREEDVLTPGVVEAKNNKTFKQQIKPYYLEYQSLRKALKKKIFSRNRKVSTAKKHKLTLMMVVHNEEGRFLKESLESVRNVISNAVIIDDASTDDTAKLCREYLKGVDLKIIKNKKSLFSQEYKLRQQSWDEVIKTKPEWILSLDADEVMEPKFVKIVDDLMNNQSVDSYGFNEYDMWNESSYRDDELWNAHRRYRFMMHRYQPNYRYRFKKTNQHCGSFPKNAQETGIYCEYPLRVKHLGWMRDEDKQRKYKRYMRLDPEGKNNSLAQYRSILDKNPHLVKFEDEK